MQVYWKSLVVSMTAVLFLVHSVTSSSYSPSLLLSSSSSSSWWMSGRTTCCLDRQERNGNSRAHWQMRRCMESRYYCDNTSEAVASTTRTLKCSSVCQIARGGSSSITTKNEKKPTNSKKVSNTPSTAQDKQNKDDDNDEESDEEDDNDDDGDPTTTSTTTADDSAKRKELEEMIQYRMQQHLLLSSRSMQLRQALIDRGVVELSHSPPVSEGNSKQTAAAIVDWECAVASPRHPKSCLYSFDAEYGTKVIAPLVPSKTSSKQPHNYQWITLSALNRLRRNDYTKVEPLWHNQCSILSNWFNPNTNSHTTTSPTSSSHYSLYQHLNPTARLVSYVLDRDQIVLSTILLSTLMLLFIATIPLWDILLHFIVTNNYVWRYWPHWSRFVHASLPLQLLLVQITFKAIQSAFAMLYNTVRNELVEYECTLYEQCIPVTFIENDVSVSTTTSTKADRYTNTNNRDYDDDDNHDNFGNYDTEQEIEQDDDEIEDDEVVEDDDDNVEPDE